MKAPKIFLFFIFFTHLYTTQCFFDIQDIISRNMTRLPRGFSTAMKDIAQGLPVKSLTIVRGKSTSIRQQDMFHLMCLLNAYNIQVINLDLMTPTTKDNYYKFLKIGLDTSDERTSLILCEPYECEKILYELTAQNLIHRSILYMFYWAHGTVSEDFLRTMKEAMRIVVITNPRKSVFRVYYNQGTPNRMHHLSLVNWWSDRLYKSPLLPPADKVYHNFQGRVFDVPVLHAPPWHFVQFNNDSSVNVTGGRDDKLLALIAKKLNFKYRYYDPPERSQGSSISGNGTFKGTLGLIWKRKADFFIGDVTMTWERLQAVEFSFLTLADSGAFLTHAPAKLSETLAIIRPFRWEVWPLVFATLLVTGPALWMVIAAPYLWQKRRCDQLQLLNNCCWFTTTLFLKQSSSKEPSNTHKARLVSVLISLGATYVIGDMYSANLTSLLARPARERPIGTLQDLEEAMRVNGYELVVERHSSSLTILQAQLGATYVTGDIYSANLLARPARERPIGMLQDLEEAMRVNGYKLVVERQSSSSTIHQNGTGVYGRLARLMRRQRIQRVRSVEVGVRMVLARKRVAVLGGRETLYYDTERFGSHNFHLSEKLYTRYSAIALQIGCPYLETFNSVVMTLFEAGILSKMTTDEYKNLPEQSRRSEPVTESDQKNSDVTENTATASQPQSESTIGLEPVSLRMLRGAFCLLGIGYFFSAITLIVEIQLHRRAKQSAIITRSETHHSIGSLTRIKKNIQRQIRRFVRAIFRHVDGALGPGLG